jgi:hypothetical protein
MRRSQLVGAVILATAAAAIVSAQEPPRTMTALAIAVGCAPPPTLDVPDAPFRIVGAQDVVARTEFDERDTIVVGSGSEGGLQVGQQFYVRRANRFGGRAPRQGARTLGWLRIISVNETTALARFDHVCGAVGIHDYLETYAAPVVPAGADRADLSGQPDFESLGRVVAGNEGRSDMAVGDFALIDRGTDQGVAPGHRYSVYRDVRADGMPLASVGEAVVISTSATMALTRITRAAGAITTGDYVAPRK